MNGTVISYLVDVPLSHGAAHSFRQHDVPDVFDEQAIEEQLRDQRGELPPATCMFWYR